MRFASRERSVAKVARPFTGAACAEQSRTVVDTKSGARKGALFCAFTYERTFVVTNDY